MSKILIVDDEPCVLLFIQALLKITGHVPATVNDGPAALKLLEKDAFDLIVIASICMSPMDGISLLREIKSRYSSIPVIIMSSYCSDETREEAMKSGAYAVVLHPCRAEELLAPVRRALGTEETSADAVPGEHSTSF